MGTADVSGILNVYDDQMWLIRELLNAYRLTGDEKFLTEAEYLTGYVLDGWDSTLDDNGAEYGGITWGPGYSTKHSCSNGPIVSPLVWLHEIYKDSNDEITYLYIDTDRSRKTKTVRKSDYYLDFAKRVYAWQKNHLRRDDGVYADMMHNPGTPLNPGDVDLGEGVQLELIDGVYYRKHANMAGYTGEAYSYNSGTMISGAADLYRVTQQQTYLDDLKELSGRHVRLLREEGCNRRRVLHLCLHGQQQLVQRRADARLGRCICLLPREDGRVPRLVPEEPRLRLRQLPLRLDASGEPARRMEPRSGTQRRGGTLHIRLCRGICRTGLL